jgi:3-oxoacyl-[acyl-carrier protein] reductase
MERKARRARPFPCGEEASVDLGMSGKVALVTAASKGLGRAIATELAREGARVVISSRDEEALSRTATEIREETGAEVDYRAADLRNAADIEALVSHAAERFGGVDILVNNTGGPPAGTFEDLDDEAWQTAFEQILLSLIRCVRGVLPHMREGEPWGRIVNVASSSVKQPIENLTLSNTFRAGLAGLAKSLSLELAPDGILVNTLGPGRISTARSESMDASQAESQGVSVEEVRGSFESRIPLGRYGTPEEFARVAAFLASPANGYVTGQAILVDGGMVRAL